MKDGLGGREAELKFLQEQLTEATRERDRERAANLNIKVCCYGYGYITNGYLLE